LKEHLVRLRLKSGANIDFTKDGEDVTICLEDHCVVIPKATGELTTQLFALLDPLSEETIVPEELDAEY
jgi:hypothetical protein